ncbi:MAG: CCA tRNA nucleotidyltransferase [Alphaproteobacteria bacterium]
MQPSGKIPLQPWMAAPETRAVIAALTAEGAEVRFVGGCVRDAVIGRPVKDIDIATHDEPERVIRLLEQAGLRAVPTGIAHGTITAISGRAHFEITTLREDVETYGRRAKIAFTDDWMRDASRRDFTFNALFCAPDGTLYDPFGGLKDLKAGRVKFVGEPEARIREDVLRLLRFFRFHAHYGKGAPDEAGLDACRRLASLLPTLSGERVAGETLRLLVADDPAPVVRLMIEDKILAPILPELADWDRLAALVGIEREEAEPDGLRRLASLIARDGEAARKIASVLRLSNQQAERLTGMASAAPGVTVTDDRRVQRRELYRLGAEPYRDLALLDWARERATGAAPDPKQYRALLVAAAQWKPVSLPVKGQDVLELGIAAGPEVGELLQAVEAWWVEGDFKATRAQCVAKLKKLAGRTAGR